MSNETNSGRLTPANIIATISMALLALFTFFGHLYGSGDGQMGKALLFTILEVVLLSSALVLAIKAKKADSHFGMWRIVKYASLVLYVAVAFIFASPLLKYFYVTSEKDKLQEMARQEIAAIDSLYIDYNRKMKTATQNASQRLKDYVDNTGGSYYSARKSSSMEDYINMMNIDKSDIDNWGAKITKVWRVPTDSTLNEMQNKVNNWGYFDMNIAQVGANIKTKAEQTVNMLNEKVKMNTERNHIIPVFDLSYNQYVHSGYVEESFSCPVMGKFHDALRDGNGTTVVGWAMFFVLHLLILLNFAVTLGTGIVLQKKGRNMGGNGIPLDWQ